MSNLFLNNKLDRAEAWYRFHIWLTEARLAPTNEVRNNALGCISTIAQLLQKDEREQEPISPSAQPKTVRQFIAEE